MGLTFGVGAIARACSGMWQYLTARVRGRIEVDLEHARNQATAQAILLLPPGGELWETEPGGRTRIIRMPTSAEPSRSHPQLTESPEQ
jgi:hypothetical protein